jgi:chromosome segregation ATPase
MAEGEAESELQRQNRQLKAYVRHARDQIAEFQARIQHDEDALEAKDMRISALEPLVNEASAEKQNFELQIAALQTHITELNAAISDLRRNPAPSALAPPSPDFLSEIDRLNLQHQNDLSTIAALNSENERFKSNSNPTVQSEIERLNLQHEKDLSEIARLNSELSNLKSQHPALLSEIGRLNSQHEEDVSELDRLKSELAPLQSKSTELGELHHQYSELDAEFQSYRAKAKRLKLAVTGIRDENKRLMELNPDGQREEIESLRLQLSQQTKAVDDLRSEKSKWAKAFETMKAELLETRKLHKQMDRLIQSENTNSRRLSEALELKQNEIDLLERSLMCAENDSQSHGTELSELRKKTAADQTEILNLQRQKSQFIQRLREIENRRSHICLEKSPVVFAEAGQSVAKKEESLSLPYFQSLLLQFFTQSPKARDTLVPVILKCVNCADADIQAALHAWKSSNAKPGFSWFPHVG